MSATLHTATHPDLAQVWPAARASRLFDDIADLEAFWSVEPWRVRVGDRGEAAVVERWREQLDILAITGLWCSTRRVPALVADIGRTAIGRGFGRVLSPLVPDDASRPWRRAGLSAVEEVVVMRLDRRRARPLSRVAGPGARTRPGTPEDLDAVLAVDASAFADFWRYDCPHVERYAACERLAVAEESGEVVGYTLSTVRRGEGSLGRLAVRSEAQGRGIGTLLLADALDALAERGAERVMLSTQARNHRSRALYERAGFRRLPGTLLAMLSEPLG